MADYYLVELGPWGFVSETPIKSLTSARKKAISGIKNVPEGYAIIESDGRPTLGIRQKRNRMGEVTKGRDGKYEWWDGKVTYRLNKDGTLGSVLKR